MANSWSYWPVAHDKRSRASTACRSRSANLRISRSGHLPASVVGQLHSRRRGPPWPGREEHLAPAKLGKTGLVGSPPAVPRLLVSPASRRRIAAPIPGGILRQRLQRHCERRGLSPASPSRIWGDAAACAPALGCRLACAQSCTCRTSASCLGSWPSLQFGEMRASAPPGCAARRAPSQKLLGLVPSCQPVAVR